MERKNDVSPDGTDNGEQDNNIADIRNTELYSIMQEAYKEPRLMSLLTENLMYCNDIGAALYAVATGNEKALLETLCK